MAAAGLVVYLGIALGGAIRTAATISLVQIAVVLVLTLLLAAIHEAVHGIVMLAFGAKPEFGVLRVDGVPAGFYATAPGYRFGRRAYLVVCLAPLAVLAPLGVPACRLPFGAYLVVPFAIHLAGCIGDLDIFRHVLAAPSDALVEDLRDGMRLWRAEPEPSGSPPPAPGTTPTR
jgi:Putative zincin peptidase